jgi:hypothetical protein
VPGQIINASTTCGGGMLFVPNNVNMVNQTPSSVTYTWSVWSAQYVLTSSAVTTNSAVATTNLWPIWNEAYAITGGGGVAYWPAWNGVYTTNIAATAEARARFEQQHRANQEQQRLYQETLARRTQEVNAASRRAEDLLRRHLSDEQREDLEKKHCFYLTSHGKDGKSRRYRIDRGTHGNVKLLDDKGSIVGSYCVQPDGVPAADAMLAQKLWIETDEDAFLKVANFRRHG